MNLMRIILLMSIFLFTSMMAGAQGPTFPPRNETDRDPSLMAFTTLLRKAIEQKDAEFLLSVVDQNVSGAIGGEGGLEEFIDVWQPHKPEGKLWPVLKHVVELGGVYLQDMADETGRYQFVFPYVYDMDFEVDVDYYSLGVITGKNVNLREKPDTRAPVLSQLSYNTIWYLYDETIAGAAESGRNDAGDPEWYLVETYDRKYRGWVNWRYVYSPMGYRLFLYKNVDGNWKISAFMVGD